MGRVDGLLARATKETGFDDFGDPAFREPLERLVESADAEARLSDEGRVAFDALVVGRLTARLRIEDAYARHPEIADESVATPLVGLGLPRTGSTAFANLLAVDPGVRVVHTWESFDPCPPAEPVAPGEADPRIARAAGILARGHRESPRRRAMVPSTAESPTECGIFLSYAFVSQFFQSMVRIPTFTHWLLHEADPVPAYRYLERVLKLLQWQRPAARWRLKSPSHSQFIGALDEVFPGARFWMTHRDVTRVIPSVTDLYYEQHRRYSDDIDLAELARFNAENWELAMHRMIAFRDAGNDDRFFDVAFDEFQRDPFAVIARLYHWLGEDLTDETLARMRAWRDGSPRVPYEATPLDIDPDDLRARFGFYSERFLGSGVAP